LSKALVTLEFCSKLIARYKADPYYRQVLRILGVNKLSLAIVKEKSSVPFIIAVRLIYYTTLKGLR
jgi:hypothetical protein